MPNWCYTRITICHSDKSVVDTYESEMNKALSVNPLKADFGNAWMGNLLLHIGMPSKEVLEGPIHCRGSVEYINREDDNTLYLETETAWSPYLQCILMFLDHYATGYAITYMANEPNMGIYCTNDWNSVGNIIIDCCQEEDFPDALVNIYEEYNDASREEVQQALSEYLGCDGPFEKLAQAVDEYLDDASPDSYIAFWSYEYVDVKELL